MSFYTYCCRCGIVRPSESVVSSISSSVSQSSSVSVISSFLDSCAPCSVFPRRFGFTSTAAMFTFNSRGGTRTDCGGWAQHNTLIHTGSTVSSPLSAILTPTVLGQICAVWQTTDKGKNTNNADSCSDAVMPRWEMFIRSNGSSAFAELYSWHTGDLVFGTPVEFWSKWASASLSPVSGSDCVMDVTCTYSSSFSGFPLATYTTNGTLAPSIILAPE